MIKAKYLGAGLLGAAVIGAGGLGFASAAATNSSNTNVGSSGIPRSTFKNDRLEAAATVLNTSTSNIQTAHKDKTLSQLISKAGLTKKTFREKVRSQTTTELKSQGYSQDQITIAFQHRTILKLRHHKK